MMSSHSIYDFLRLLVFLQYFHTEIYVSTLLVMVERFAYVMQKTCSLCGTDILAYLGCQKSAQVTHLN